MNNTGLRSLAYSLQNPQFKLFFSKSGNDKKYNIQIYLDESLKRFETIYHIVIIS